jgi:hypothetical protein
MGQIEWRFVQKPDNIGELEHYADEFFSGADDETSGLVRESIQNSLDEALDNSVPVKVVFTLGELTPETADKYVAALRPHLAESTLRELPDFAKRSRFLAIEDFNTRGLEGPTTPDSPSEAASRVRDPFKPSFWFFEWKSGGSNKSAENGNRGNWGIGKAVFPRASLIKTYFVQSVRRPQAAPAGDTSILFGRSILKWRWVTDPINGNVVRYMPDCRWMVSNPAGELIPSDDLAVQLNFIADWNLARQPGELGTSIVIPFCRDELAATDIVQSIILEYFIAIIGGQLECEVRDVGGTSTRIDKTTLPSLIAALPQDAHRRRGRTREELAELCRLFEAHEYNKVYEHTLRVPSQRPIDWTNVKIDDAVASTILSEFNSGSAIRLLVEVAIPSMTDPKMGPSIDKFAVLLCRANGLRSATIFCREGILIPKANSGSVLQNCVSMVYVGDLKSSGTVQNSLANFLKFAEGPAHEKWSTSATTFIGRYMPKSHAEAAIKWVKNSAERSLRLILGAEEEEDDTTLGGYFPVDEGDDERPDVGRVVLTGRRNPSNPEEALFAWRTEGIDPVSVELAQIEPAPEAKYPLEVLPIGRAVAPVPDLHGFYKFRLTITDGAGTKHNSVVVVIFPLGGGEDLPRILIERTANGFNARTANGHVLQSGYRFIVIAAYKVAGSSSIKNWIEEDFILDSMLIDGSLEGLTKIAGADNWIEFEAKGGAINAEWGGFDPLRDVLVELRRDN